MGFIYMTQLQLLTATRLLERTMPATTRRLLAYGALALAYLTSIPIGAGTFFGLASFGENPAFWAQTGAMLGLAFCFYLIRLARPHIFHHVDLVHWAAMTKRLAGENLPAGKEQLTHLSEFLRSSFPSAKASYGGYLNVHRIICEIFASFLPGNRLNRLPQPLASRLQQTLAAVFLGWGAGAILAFAIQANRLSACRRGAVVYGEHYKEVFIQSLLASAFLYGFSLIAFWILLKPVGWVDAALPSDLGVWQYVFALILTYWIKASFLDPIATAAMTISLLQLEQQTPSTSEEKLQEWVQRAPSLAQIPAEGG